MVLLVGQVECGGSALGSGASRDVSQMALWMWPFFHDQVPGAAAGVTSSRRIRVDRKVSGQKKWVSGPPVSPPGGCFLCSS